MARFYGKIKGARGEVSRLGHKNSGLRVTAQTWSESFDVRLWASDSDNGKEQTDYGSVFLGNFCLFSGPVTQFTSEEGIVDWLACRVRANRSIFQKVMAHLANEALEMEAYRE